MPRKPPQWTQGFVDRHGKARWYFRKRGMSLVPLPGLPWSPEFMTAYEAAQAGQGTAIAASKTRPGTISALVVGYYNSIEFRRLSPATKATYRGIIERFRIEHGDKTVANLQKDHIKRLMAAKAETPAAANNFLRMVRMLMVFAVEIGMRRDDPTLGIKKIKSRSTGFYTWTEDDIAKFEQKHPLGTRARLALALLLYTAQRRSDVVRMGRQHIRDGKIEVRQQKTGTRLLIPMHNNLVEIITASKCNHLTFLVTKDGKPFSPAGFTNWFVECADEAELPAGCTPHGLRKAACRRLAEAGCSPNQIMAVSGHKSLKEVTLYTAAAEQERLASSAMSTINWPDREQTLSNQGVEFDNLASNSLKNKG